MRYAFATASVAALLIAGPAQAQAPAKPATEGAGIVVTQPPPVATVQPYAPADINVGSTAPPATAIDRAPAAGAAIAPAAGVFPMAAEVEKFIGKDVYGMRGNEVGEIENLLIDPDGRVRAAVIEFGGLLGIGENEVALPWDQLKVTGDRIMVNMTEDQIKAEPRWTRERPGSFAEFRPYR
ncbi:MAG: PRC-barrel domain-containing protein [Alphaproteobacteria bacterium]